MSALRSLSDSTRELDGLHDLLERGEQMMFDAGTGRERRRGKEGFASPADARAFLQMSRVSGPVSFLRRIHSHARISLDRYLAGA